MTLDQLILKALYPDSSLAEMAAEDAQAALAYVKTLSIGSLQDARPIICLHRAEGLLHPRKQVRILAGSGEQDDYASFIIDTM